MLKLCVAVTTSVLPLHALGIGSTVSTIDAARGTRKTKSATKILAAQRGSTPLPHRETHNGNGSTRSKNALPIGQHPSMVPQGSTRIIPPNRRSIREQALRSFVVGAGTSEDNEKQPEKAVPVVPIEHEQQHDTVEQRHGFSSASRKIEKRIAAKQAWTAPLENNNNALLGLDHESQKELESQKINVTPGVGTNDDVDVVAARAAQPQPNTTRSLLRYDAPVFVPASASSDSTDLYFAAISPLAAGPAPCNTDFATESTGTACGKKLQDVIGMFRTPDAASSVLEHHDVEVHDQKNVLNTPTAKSRPPAQKLWNDHAGLSYADVVASGCARAQLATYQNCGGVESGVGDDPLVCSTDSASVPKEDKKFSEYHVQVPDFHLVQQRAKLNAKATPYVPESVWRQSAELGKTGRLPPGLYLGGGETAELPLMEHEREKQVATQRMMLHGLQKKPTAHVVAAHDEADDPLLGVPWPERQFFSKPGDVGPATGTTRAEQQVLQEDAQPQLSGKVRSLSSASTCSAPSPMRPAILC